MLSGSVRGHVLPADRALPGTRHRQARRRLRSPERVRELAMPGPDTGPPTERRPVAGRLVTTVVGSYSVPEWLDRLKTDAYQRRISRRHLDDIHDVAIKAAIKGSGALRGG